MVMYEIWSLGRIPFENIYDIDQVRNIILYNISIEMPTQSNAT
jgi:hypothetical protein